MLPLVSHLDAMTDIQEFLCLTRKIYIMSFDIIGRFHPVVIPLKNIYQKDSVLVRIKGCQLFVLHFENQSK